MNQFRRIVGALFGLTFLALTQVHAQELTVLAGTMHSDPGSSYTFEVDYRQNFIRYFAGSVSYINEGHVVGHHRDGTAFELLGRLPFNNDRYEISVGVGPYFFYDTRPLLNGDTENIHGTAPIFTLSGTAYLSNRWYVRALFNRIHSRELDT